MPLKNRITFAYALSGLLCVLLLITSVVGLLYGSGGFFVCIVLLFALMWRILSARKTTPGPMGRPMAVEYEITAYERPQRMISHTIRGLPLVDVESVETFEPVVDGTRMRWEWEIRPRGAIGELMTPVLALVLTNRLEGAFANIKKVLESDASAARINEPI